MRQRLNRLVRLVAPPMTATPIEIRSRLALREFETAIEHVPEVFEHGDAHVEDYRARAATVEIEGDIAHVRLRSGALARPNGRIGGSTLYIIEARLTGPIAAAEDGSVFSAGLRTLNGFQDAVFRPLPSIFVAASIATIVTAAAAPSVVLVPGVVASGALFGFVSAIVSLRWAAKQRSDEIAKMLRAMNKATASTVADPAARPDQRAISRLFGPWLHDIPASSIVKRLRSLEDGQVADQVGSTRSLPHR